LTFFFSAGKDLVAAKNLLNRHEVILADIANHEPRIQLITERGNKMVQEGMCDLDCVGLNHYARPLGRRVLGLLGN
jgi:hypothetical protein